MFRKDKKQKKKANSVRWLNEMIEKQKMRLEKSKIQPIEFELVKPHYNKEDGDFEYAEFANKEGGKKKKRYLRLFRVRSVSNYVRTTHDNSLEFKKILSKFAKDGVSFVTMYGFKPGKDLLITYGVLVEEQEKTKENQNPKDKAIKESKQYIEALETKFRSAYQNVEIEDLNLSQDWLFEGFYYENLSLVTGIPKPDDSLGVKTGTTYGNGQQAGVQVGENLLKGATSKRNKKYAEGFPFLMYSVFDRLDELEVFRVKNDVEKILSQLSTSKQLFASEGESVNMPFIMGLGFNTMTGENHSQSMGQTDTESVSKTDSTSHMKGTAMTNQEGSSTGFSDGRSTQNSTQESNTDTKSKQGGLNWIGNVSAGESNASQSGQTNSTGQTLTRSDQISQSQSNQTSEQTGSSHSTGVTNAQASSKQEAFGTSQGQGQGSSAAGGVGIGDNSSISRTQYDYYQETAEHIYGLYYQRIKNSLRDGMYDYRMMVLTPDEDSKITVDELIKQSYIDVEAPYPVKVEELDKKENRMMMNYARTMAKPYTLQNKIAIPDKHRFSTYITPNEASAFNLPQVNMAGYLSSFDPIPESVGFVGEMDKGAKVGKQLNPQFNMKTRYPYYFTKDKLGHMGVFSMTGQGKTVFLQRFLSEVHNRFGMNVILFDWTTNHRSIVGTLKDEKKFRINTFKRGLELFRYNPVRTPPGVEETTWNAVLAETLCYSMGLGDRSFRIIKKVLKYVKKKARETKTEATLKDMVKGIDREFLRRQKEYEDSGMRMPFNEQQTFSSIKERIEEWTEEDEIIHDALCTGEPLKIEEMIEGEFVHLIECKHLPLDIRPFVINTIAAGIFHYCSSREKKLKKPTYLVFEEAHAVLQMPTGEEPLKINETIFETINREARNYNLFISYVCQSPEKLPPLIFDNLPIKVVLQLPSHEGKEKIVSAGGRDPLRLDVDLMKWLSRQPIGTCLIRNSKFKRMQEGEFAAVCVDPVISEELSDDLIKKIVYRNKRKR